MKKRFILLIQLLFVTSIYSSTQRYRDNFFIENHCYKTISVKYTISELLEPCYIYGPDFISGYKLDFGERIINFHSNNFLQYDNCEGLIVSDGFAVFNTYAYDYTKFYKMDWFSKFLLITGELIITDEDGNILMTLDTITRDDFEVTEENGITTATLIIRDKS